MTLQLQDSILLTINAIYFDKLFYLQRDRQFAQGLLQGGTQATATILTITRASEITFGVIAAAFGFSSSLVDSVAGSFLFQLPPATTYGFVKDLQTAYRKGVDPKYVTSSSAAYHLMQDYLAICLPPNIEARLVSRVANIQATPQRPSASNPSPGVQVADRFVSSQPTSTPAIRPHDVIRKPVRTASRPDTTISQFFPTANPNRDSPTFLANVLKNLCAPEITQDTATWTKKVNALIAIYEQTSGLEVKPNQNGKIDDREINAINSSGKGQGLDLLEIRGWDDAALGVIKV